MPAGEIKVEEVKGDKDLDHYAGQITISSFHEWNYRSVSASVTIGEVWAPMYNPDRGGFSRSINRKSSEGEYWLRAHIMTGEIDLEGRKATLGQARQSD